MIRTTNQGRRWERHEDTFMRTHYLKQGGPWCAGMLKRSKQSVYDRAKKLGLVLDRESSAQLRQDRLDEAAERGLGRTRIPTQALPGSREKLDALAARVAAGETLWHPLDAVGFGSVE